LYAAIRLIVATHLVTIQYLNADRIRSNPT